MQINGNNTCVCNRNWLNPWRNLTPENAKPAESSEVLSGNCLRITDPALFQLVTDSAALEPSTDAFLQNGQTAAKTMAENRYVLTLIGIPTTIPTNSTYRTNLPKQHNFYAVPYIWWSSVKKIPVTIEPTEARGPQPDVPVSKRGGLPQGSPRPPDFLEGWSR